MRKSTKIAVVLAAAALLVAGFAFTTLAKGWVKEAEGLFYYEDEYGMKVYNEWKKDGANYYYLGDDGYMVTNTLVEYTDGKKYWCGADGAKVMNAWVQVPADQEDIDELEVEYRWYRFDSKGQAVTGKQTIDGNTYFFFDNGKMAYGYVNYNSEAKSVVEMTTSVKTAYEDGNSFNYYCGTNETGAALKNEWRNEVQDASDDAYEASKTFWAFYQSSGAKATSGLNNGILWKGQRYYFTEAGKMVTGWGEATVSVKTEDGSKVVTVSTYNGGADEGVKAKKAWKYLKPSDAASDSTDKFWFWFKGDGNAINTEAGDAPVQKINGKFYAFGAPDTANPYASEMLSGPVYLVFGEKADVVTDATFAAKIKFSDSKEGFTLDEWLNMKDEEGKYVEDVNVYYFSGDEANDGSLKKNVTFSQEFKDDTYTLAVGSDGKLKNGYVSKEKKFYRFGYLLAASEDMRYEVKNVFNAKISATERKDYALLGVSGAEVASGTVADADGSYYYVEKDTGKIFKADSSLLSAAKAAAAFKKDGGKEAIKIDGVDYYVKAEETRTNGYYKLYLERK